MHTIFAILPASTADCIGKIDIQSLSDQTRMELLFSGLDDKRGMVDEHGEFYSILAWKALQFDDDDNVQKIYVTVQDETMWVRPFDDHEPGGSIDLQFIPETVTDFAVTSMALHGTVETRQLPKELDMFSISRNNFTGAFDLSGLPPGISEVFIDSNRLSGSIDLPSAAKLLRRLNAGENCFSGSVDLTKLRYPISHILLGGNQLSGTIDLSRIPASLRSMYLINNKFSQDVLTIGDLSAVMYGIHVDASAFKELVQGSDTPLHTSQRGKLVTITAKRI